MFLTRPDYQKSEGESDPTFSNKAMLWIKKHRNGKLENLAFETDLSIQKWMEPGYLTPFPNPNSPAIKSHYEVDAPF